MRTENDGIIEESGDDIGEHWKSCRSGQETGKTCLTHRSWRVKANADLIGRTALEGEARRHGSFQHQRNVGGYREVDR